MPKVTCRCLEDQNGGVEDVWFALDADRNGVAESISKWISLTTPRR